ncbi:unnamed protein product, partial [Adineta steineri]
NQLTVMRTVRRQIYCPNAPAQTPEAYQRINLFIALLDRFISSLANRFSPHRWMAYEVSPLISSMIEKSLSII